MIDITLLPQNAQDVYAAMSTTPNISRTIRNIALRANKRRKVVKALLHLLEQAGHVTHVERTPLSQKRRPVFSPVV